MEGGDAFEAYWDRKFAAIAGAVSLLASAILAWLVIEAWQEPATVRIDDWVNAAITPLLFGVSLRFFLRLVTHGRAIRFDHLGVVVGRASEHIPWSEVVEVKRVDRTTYAKGLPISTDGPSFSGRTSVRFRSMEKAWIAGLASSSGRSTNMPRSAFSSIIEGGKLA